MHVCGGWVSECIHACMWVGGWVHYVVGVGMSVCTEHCKETA